MKMSKFRKSHIFTHRKLFLRLGTKTFPYLKSFVVCDTLCGIQLNLFHDNLCRSLAKYFANKFGFKAERFEKAKPGSTTNKKVS